jgi:hypothetical protein
MFNRSSLFTLSPGCIVQFADESTFVSLKLMADTGKYLNVQELFALQSREE